MNQVTDTSSSSDRSRVSFFSFFPTNLDRTSHTSLRFEPTRSYVSPQFDSRGQSHRGTSFLSPCVYQVPNCVELVLPRENQTETKMGRFHSHFFSFARGMRNSSLSTARVFKTMVDKSVTRTYAIPDLAKSCKKEKKGAKAVVAVTKSSSISMTCSEESSLPQGSDHDLVPPQEPQEEKDNSGGGTVDGQDQNVSQDLDSLSINSTDSSAVDNESLGTNNTFSVGTTVPTKPTDLKSCLIPLLRVLGFWSLVAGTIVVGIKMTQLASERQQEQVEEEVSHAGMNGIFGPTMNHVVLVSGSVCHDFSSSHNPLVVLPFFTSMATTTVLGFGVGTPSKCSRSPSSES